jgi:hypothetical protein
VTWHVGKRTGDDAYEFMSDLKGSARQSRTADQRWLCGLSRCHWRNVRFRRDRLRNASQTVWPAGRRGTRLA